MILAVDPEGKHYADNKHGSTRQKILAEIRDVLKIQGADGAINDAEIEVLIEIHRWTEACYAGARRMREGVVGPGQGEPPGRFS